MLENQNNQVIINNLSHDGRGVVTLDGKKILIDGALPGEKIEFKYTKRHKRYDEAKVFEVIDSSEERVKPVCPNFLTCGGCSYQHLAADKQMVYKQSIVAELLKHFADNVKPKRWLAPLQAKTEDYRTKARLSVKFVIKKQKVLIGFREKSSSFIADMESCSVLHDDLNNLLIPLADLIGELTVFDKIPQVELAMGDHYNKAAADSLNKINGRNIAVILRVLSELTTDDLNKLQQFKLSHDINLIFQLNDNVCYSLNNEKNLINEVPSLYYTVEHQDFKIDYHFYPRDFTQVNLGLNNLMLNQAINILNLCGDESVLDLFCGLGNFTLPIGKILEKGKGSILGIEGDESMVTRAGINADYNKVTNATFKSMDLYNRIDTTILNNNKKYDCIILDPPRAGAKELLPIIAEMNPEKILYVSCDPATFARDVGVLCNQYGYILDSVGIMDMFPHTKHVETMGLLLKTK